MSVILCTIMFWRRLLGKTHAITVYKSQFFYVFKYKENQALIISAYLHSNSTCGTRGREFLGVGLRTFV